MALGKSSHRSFATSVALHCVIILGCVISWHLPIHGNSAAVPPIVPVDLVTIVDETDITPMAREQLLLPEKDKNVAPASSAAWPEAAPTIEMKLFPETSSKPSSDTKKSNHQGENSDPAAAPSSAPRNAIIGDNDIAGFSNARAMTMSLADALRNQIAQCWHPPAIAAGGGQVVSLVLFLDSDGSISRPPQATAAPAGSDPQNLHAGEEAVRRAIYTCAPYALPAGATKNGKTSL